MIRVGIVGLGFMGRMHYRCWTSTPGAQVTAICEANPSVLDAAKKAPTGNVTGAADHIDLDSLKVFSSLDDLIASGTVDAVSITLPTFLHPDTTVKALGAGLHVLCEKPMALSVAECDRMIAAAKQANRVLQIGHCIRFWPEYTVARDIVRSGKYGKLVAASFRRYSTQPAWSPDNWFADEQRSGGQALDLHIHDADYIHYLLGLPEFVSSIADPAQGYISSQYHYGDGKAVVAESCWRMAASFGFEMSFVMVLESATITFDCTRDPAFRVCPAEGESFTPELPSGDGYSREVEHFLQAITGPAVEPVVTPWESRETIRLVLGEKESARERCRVTIDPAV